MSDPSAVPSALGIEAVEWIAEGGENLTVQVTGRWRRRRPAWSGQPTLIVEAPGRRYRFPAMPEPPSLSGAGPGMWRMSFSVPAALAPELGGRSWLQFGSVAVPLPSAVEPRGSFAGRADSESAGDDEGVDPPAFDEPGPALGSEPASAPSRVEPGASTASRHPGLAPPAQEDPARRTEEAEAAVTALTGVVRDLEADLAAARIRADELATELALQETERRGAQQREHAERALRLDLARQLAARNRESERARQAYGELAEAEARVRELETELETARRRIDEAEQAAAAATARRHAEQAAAAGRERAEHETAQAAQRRSDTEAARLRFEAALGDRRAGPDRVPNEPRLPAVRELFDVPAMAATSNPSPVPAAVVRPGADALIVALRGELELRAGAEAGLRARLVDAEARLAARAQLGDQMGETLTALRRELDGLRVALGIEREARLAAERRVAELDNQLGSSRVRSRDALTAISELRATLASLTPPPAPPPPARGSEVEHARLSEALARLREQAIPPEEVPVTPEPIEPPPAAPEAVEPPPAVPDVVEPPPAVPESVEPPPAVPESVEPPPAAAPEPIEPAPAAPEAFGVAPANADTRAWLAPIFAELARSEPAQAGRLLIELLPAQGAVVTEPVNYDLLIGPEDAVRVSAGDGPVLIVTGKPARARAAVDFQVAGDHAALARMIVAGRLGRRFGRGVARVRGRRAGAAALDALVGARLDLAELYRLGVRFESRTALLLIAGLIDPALTAKERFSVAYSVDGGTPNYLLVRGGEAVLVTGERPEGGIAISVVGPAGTLERVLSGERPEGATVLGDEWPLALLRKWVKAAQSG